MAHPLKSVLRAGALGLAGGLFLSGLALGGFAWQRSALPCAAPGTEECAFELRTNGDVARLQAFGALGCALVAAGLTLATRRR